MRASAGRPSAPIHRPGRPQRRQPMAEHNPDALIEIDRLRTSGLGAVARVRAGRARPSGSVCLLCRAGGEIARCSTCPSLRSRPTSASCGPGCRQAGRPSSRVLIPESGRHASRTASTCTCSGRPRPGRSTGGHTVSDLSASGPYLDDLFAGAGARPVERGCGVACARAMKTSKPTCGPAAGDEPEQEAAQPGTLKAGSRSTATGCSSWAGAHRRACGSLGHPPAHLDGAEGAQAIVGGHAADALEVVARPGGGQSSATTCLRARPGASTTGLVLSTCSCAPSTAPTSRPEDQVGHPLLTKWDCSGRKPPR